MIDLSYRDEIPKRAEDILNELIITYGQAALTENGNVEKEIKGNKSLNKEADLLYFNTKTLKYIIKQVNLVAPSAYNVIIYGENGIGKKTIAYEIHKRSRRRDMTFLSIDSSGFREKFKKNIELINGGTLFIKKIEQLSIEDQKLLLGIIKDKRTETGNSFKDIDIRDFTGPPMSFRKIKTKRRFYAN